MAAEKVPPLQNTNKSTKIPMETMRKLEITYWKSFFYIIVVTPAKKPINHEVFL